MGGEPSFSSSLVMIGTVHRDPRGVGKLLRILERESPDLITVEISPYALEFRERQAFCLRTALKENLKNIRREEEELFPRLVSRGEIQGIFLLLKVPFEWRGAEQYAGRRQIGLKPIDLSAYSKERLSRISELIRPDNLRALLRDPQPSIEKQVGRQYARARALWHLPAGKGFKSAEIQEREKHMAEEIRRLREEDRKRKILHIGGWEHLLPASSLFARLQDCNPRRLLLGDEE
jgi:hypothetical protein